MTKNDPQQIKLRRNQNTLITVGTGTIAFGVWSFVKTLGMTLITRPDNISGYMSAMQSGGVEITDMSETAMFWTTVVISGILLIIDVSARLFVGFSAISVGRGKRHSRWYIVIALLMILGSVISVLMILYSFQLDTEDSVAALSNNSAISNNTFSGVIIELTSTIMLIEMLAASVRVRKLNGQSKRCKGVTHEH